MPNIEIVGYNQDAYQKLKPQIDRAVQSIGLGAEAVTTWIPSMVVSCDGKETPSPYLRICTTNPDERPMIIDAFKRFGIIEDCEELDLAHFTLAKLMVNVGCSASELGLGRSDDAHEA